MYNRVWHSRLEGVKTENGKVAIAGIETTVRPRWNNRLETTVLIEIGKCLRLLME